jgi:hypothetical protein
MHAHDVKFLDSVKLEPVSGFLPQIITNYTFIGYRRG